LNIKSEQNSHWDTPRDSDIDVTRINITKQGNNSPNTLAVSHFSLVPIRIYCNNAGTTFYLDAAQFEVKIIPVW